MDDHRLTPVEHIHILIECLQLLGRPRFLQSELHLSLLSLGEFVSQVVEQPQFDSGNRLYRAPALFSLIVNLVCP